MSENGELGRKIKKGNHVTPRESIDGTLVAFYAIASLLMIFLFINWIVVNHEAIRIELQFHKFMAAYNLLTWYVCFIECAVLCMGLICALSRRLTTSRMGVIIFVYCLFMFVTRIMSTFRFYHNNIFFNEPSVYFKMLFGGLLFMVGAVAAYNYFILNKIKIGWLVTVCVIELMIVINILSLVFSRYYQYYIVDLLVDLLVVALILIQAFKVWNNRRIA